MKDQEDYMGVLNILLLPIGGLLVWITQNRKILLDFLILSPQHHRAATVVKKVVTANIRLIVDGTTIVVLHISTRVEVVLTEHNMDTIDGLF